jgi:hypothetical protein
MIEIVVLNYLSSALSAEVFMEVPDAPPERFVLLKKADGGRDNHLDYAMFTVQSYGKSLLEAAELNEEVKSVMDGIMELDAISGCYLNSDYNFTDTASKRYRYQAVFDIYHY